MKGQYKFFLQAARREVRDPRSIGNEKTNYNAVGEAEAEKKSGSSIERILNQSKAYEDSRQISGELNGRVLIRHTPRPPGKDLAC